MAAEWPGIVVEGANVTMQISALRRVLDEGRPEPSLIQSVQGRGYRFTAGVSLSNRIGTDRATPGAANSPNSEASHFSAPSAHPERRLITVLSCGTMSAATLNEDLDPEQALATIGALHRTCVAVIGS